MKEAFSLINQKERRQLVAVAALLGLTLLFYFFGAANVRKAYGKSTDLLAAIEENIAAAEESRAETETGWKRWEQANKDMTELQENNFYNTEDYPKEVRLDLQRILDESPIQHSQKRFQYFHFEKEKIGKVIVEFNVTGSYHSLKTFIHAVESLPRFLMIERIDFLDIDPQGMGIKLRVLLAGYYAQY
jgi:hypothetical protein